jgi:hypothetical protein
LRIALNLIKVEYFLSLKCEMTVDLTILTGAFKQMTEIYFLGSTVQISSSQIDSCGRFRILDFRILKYQTLVSFAQAIFQSEKIY